MVDSSELLLQEEPVEEEKISPLKLYLIRKGDDQERPMMPCSNANFLEDNADHRHGYEEPIRDRNKHWRKLLWTSILPRLMRDSNGYHAPVSRLVRINEGSQSCKIFTSGVLMNKTRILRRVRCIGAFPMIITLFGLGINGRVFIPGAHRPRFIFIQAYCPALTTTFTLQLDMPTLRESFSHHLLDPGRKKELCARIVQRLWLDQDLMQLKLGDEEMQSETDKLRNRLRQQRMERLKRVREKHGKMLAEAQPGEGGEAAAMRDRHVLHRTGMSSNHVHFILTISSVPRKNHHYRIEAYDPSSASVASMVVNAKAIAAIVQANDDPKRWKDERLREALRLLVPFVALEHDATTTTVRIKHRKGLPSARFQPILQQSPTKSQAQPAKLIKRLEALAAERETPSSRASLFSRVTPLRLIGKGRLICSGCIEMAGGRCIYMAFEEDGKMFHIELFDTVNATTSVCRCSLEDAKAYLKGREETDDPDALVLDLIRNRLRMRTDSSRKVTIDRRIYRNGARLLDVRKVPRGRFCLVAVEQCDHALLASIFIPATVQTLEYAFTSHEASAIILMHEEMSPLERTIHLFTYVSNLAIEEDETGNPFIRPQE